MDRSASVDEELTCLRAVLSELLTSPILEQFTSVWEEIGLEDAHRQDRRETMKLHLHNLLEEMLQEEVELKKKLTESISSCSAELLQLCEQLSLPKELPDAYSLYEKEKQIRTKVDLLAKEKHDRMKRFKRLTEMETAMCETVGEESRLGPQWQAQIVPSEEDLKSFRKRIEEVEEIKDQRQAVFFQIREKVVKIWTELEVEPQGGFEQLVASGDVKNFVFSQANMKLLEEFYQKTEEEAAQLEGVSIRLRETICSLWERLEVPQVDRELFNRQHQGYKPKVIAALQAEVDRLNELKKQNMAKFVEATRAELHKIWDLCFYGSEQRREFAPAFCDEFSEDLLSAHESELDRMRGFYADNKDVFRLVEKRENLWAKMQEFERKSTDPNRFQNRGGQLQKELKMKKQTMKELPKIEKELESVLVMWENDHERYFVVKDSRYLDTIKNQWEEKNEQKEKEKMQRQKTKIEMTMMEMTYGSKPSTPVKKRAATTPTSAPTKARRVGPSPLVHTTRQQTARLTQSTAPHGRKPPIASRKTPVRPQKAHGGSRKILGERNVCVTTTLPCDETFVSHADTSLASTCSYTEFQHGLQQGLELQKAARSSSIPQRSSSMDNLV